VYPGQAGHNPAVAMTATSHHQNTGQATAAAATGGKLSQTELNVIKTMTTIIVGFVICVSVPAVANFLQLLGVSIRFEFKILHY